MISIQECLWHAGDDAAWAAPDYDDTGWERIRFNELRGQPGLFWLRAAVSLQPAHAAGSEPMAVWFSAMATCDLFWDGQALALAGEPAAEAANELPGPIDGRAYLPASLLSPGEHLLAARCSTHHRQQEPVMGFYVMAVGPYLAMERRARGYAWMAMVSLSAKVLAAAYFLAVFLLGRRSWSSLWLVVLSLSAAGLLVAESWRSLVGYSYDWHIPRLLVVHSLAWMCNAALLLYHLSRFPGAGRRLLGWVALAISLLSPWWIPAFDLRVGVTFLVGFGGSVLWAAIARRRGQHGSLLALCGDLLCLALLLAYPTRFLDLGFFFALDVLLILLLVGQVQEGRLAREALDAERLRSTRLELELVKKSIQPHFLMNTLTALSEWMEQQPAVAVRMIDALGTEIRLLSELARHRTVPLAKELELCRAHLEIMGWRQGGRYRLQLAGVEEDALCPPGMVHTLVENAVTHGPPPPRGGDLVIELHAHHAEGRTHYRLISPLAHSHEAGEQEGGGTGLRYVRARLAEAYGEGWTFNAQAEDGSWVNRWSLPSAANQLSST